MRTLLLVATYNEIENLPELVDELLRVAPDADILVVDDNSPDGTGRWCDRRAAQERRLHCLHRPGKLGLGTATRDGMQYALNQGYDRLLSLDADFSHPPAYIPELLAALEPEGGNPVDVVIGSRYVPGGAIRGWPWYRRWMSRLVNGYARWLLKIPVRDSSGAFRCYRVARLRPIVAEPLVSRGYSYLEEIIWRLHRAGATFREIPIVFVDRQRGATKINLREALTALWIILRLGLGRQQPPAPPARLP